MSRLHLFEFEDQAWLPDVIRDGITDFLGIVEEKCGFYTPIVPRLRTVLDELKCKRIVDLCSGSGGPWNYLIDHLADSDGKSLKVLLTDKYRNFNHSKHNRRQGSDLEFAAHPVDAAKTPLGLPGFRTFFDSFHHFRPNEAKAILQDAINGGEGIALFEMTSRHWFPMLSILLFGPLCVLYFTPFIRPFRWLRLVLTYLAPLIPFLLVFDGIVSCLRTYSPKELQAMVEELAGSEGYHWQIGIEKCKYVPSGIIYLIGYPKTNTRTT